MTAEMPERIWAGSCEALGAPDTGYWYPVRTPSTPTEFVSASTHTRAMEALAPFAVIADRILSEAPAEAEHWVLFRSCTGEALTVSMDQLRALSRIDALTPGCVNPSDTLSSGEETS